MDKKCPISQVRTDEVFIRPDHPSICTWSAGTKEKNPHFCKPLLPRPKIAENILDVVGQTPLVKLNKIPKAAGVKCNVYVKCEFLNPGGSVKDRIAVRMIEEAEKKGLLKPGDTIIEPTSGNTGIGLAMGAAVKGYRCIIVLPEKMSNEKVNTLKALGAEVVRTPTEAPLESPENLIQVAYRLQKEIPNSIVLDQYRNKGNPLAHYDGTATEIIEQCNGKIDMIVMGAGTGGTITGIARKIRETIPTCKIVAVDPEGSTLAQLEENEIPSDVTFYEVEGIGYDFMPTVLDIGVIDKWIKVNDNDAFPMARRLIREEGLLCGGSSGAAVAKAMEVAKELKPDQNCIIILPDNIRNYLSKFVSDEWLEARNFKESINTYGHEWWLNKLTIFEPKTPPLYINIDTCVDSAIEIMKANSLDFIPVLELDGHVKGAVTMQNITLKLINKSLKYSDPISKCVTKCIKVNRQKSFIGHVSRILEKEPFVIVVQHEMIVNYDGKEKLDKESLVATITQKDIFNYITSLDARETKNGN